MKKRKQRLGKAERKAKRLRDERQAVWARAKYGPLGKPAPVTVLHLDESEITEGFDRAMERDAS